MATDISIKTRAECKAAADRWLDKAVKLEDDGKSNKMISVALDKAVVYENAAFDGRA